MARNKRSGRTRILWHHFHKSSLRRGQSNRRCSIPELLCVTSGCNAGLSWIQSYICVAFYKYNRKFRNCYGSLQTTTDKFESATLFLRLAGSPSALIQRSNCPPKTTLYENALQTGEILKRELRVSCENDDVINPNPKGCTQAFLSPETVLLRFQISSAPCGRGLRCTSFKLSFHSR